MDDQKNLNRSGGDKGQVINQNSLQLAKALTEEHALIRKVGGSWT